MVCTLLLPSTGGNIMIHVVPQKTDVQLNKIWQEYAIYCRHLLEGGLSFILSIEQRRLS